MFLPASHLVPPSAVWERESDREGIFTSSITAFCHTGSWRMSVDSCEYVEKFILALFFIIISFICITVVNLLLPTTVIVVLLLLLIVSYCAYMRYIGMYRKSSIHGVWYALWFQASPGGAWNKLPEDKGDLCAVRRGEHRPVHWGLRLCSHAFTEETGTGPWTQRGLRLSTGTSKRLT